MQEARPMQEGDRISRALFSSQIKRSVATSGLKG